jgi:Family of unknown function (DUF5681)
MGRKDQSNRGEKSASDNAAHVPIGYGQPPLASRFKLGISGNTKGRPKGSKNLKTLIREAMTASISIQEGEKTRRVTKLEGVVLRQLQSALKGSDRAALALIKMAHQLRFLEDSESATAETALSAEEERILNELLARTRKD